MERTLHDELVAIRKVLLAHDAEKPASEALVYFLANDKRYWYSLTSLAGDVLLETTREAFTHFAQVISLHLLYIDQRDTNYFGFKAADITKIDEESGLQRIDLLLHLKPTEDL